MEILKNKVAVVIGGEGFLGKEFCRVLSQNGAVVISCDKKILDCPHYYARKLIRMDASIENSVKHAVRKILNQYQKIDILVNAFAINPQPNNKKIKFEDYDLEDWNKTINVNLTGTFLCCKEFGKVMQNESIIVNIVSELGIFAPDQEIYDNYIKPCDYGVSKAGMINLTKYLASYWGSKIRINNLVLGSVYNNHKKDFVLKLSKKIPLKRMAWREEFNEALLFLCSKKSSYMTGQNLIINGGRGIF